MNDHQLMRYSRQIMLSDFDYDGQQRLLDSKILIVGMGGLGCPAAMYLAASGVGELWLADVGQDEFEEVDLIELGGNYGWNLKEGFACFDLPFPCTGGARIDPVITYDHSENDRSITGGFVYRGSEIPSLVGSYVFGDFVTGRVWGLFPSASGVMRRRCGMWHSSLKTRSVMLEPAHPVL